MIIVNVWRKFLVLEEVKISTKDPYQFRYIPNVKKDRFEFWVKAKADAHISLSNAPILLDPKVVIIIGGWDNTGTEINIWSDDVHYHQSVPDLLNENEYRGFWIKWNYNGNIAIGKKGDRFPFIAYNNTKPFFPINFIGVTCQKGYDGFWIINEDLDYKFDE
ncbi:uncharacterized protein LOC129618560 [Condylostylus longicornis]|uniref:uncharacterized protein LOC129618560 n=1 Tax=Condylostylus longicornis TaxID=2530218 RepID=UPI00244DC42B|nr:uncharacterized protein LOC129618560 [Condylostylus longicornis]